MPPKEHPGVSKRIGSQADSGEAAGQWSRVIWLDRQVREALYPSVRDLQAEFNIRRRHAFNTVAFLRDSLAAPLAYSRAKGGYFYTDPNFALPAVFLLEGELLALLLSQEVTRLYLGTELELPLRAAVAKLSRYLPEETRLEADALAEVFHFGGSGSCGVETPIALLAGLRRAIRERRAVRILYHGAHRNEETERDIEPHFLENVRGDWMCVAWDRLRGGDRVFMLSRIREWRQLGDRFELHPELAPGVYTRHHFLTEHGGEPYEVVLRFDAYQARWIRERTWHASQTVEELPGGELILRMTVSGEGDLLRWVMGYGSHVEVLAPARLRERVVEDLRLAVDRYADEGRGE